MSTFTSFLLFAFAFSFVFSLPFSECGNDVAPDGVLPWTYPYLSSSTTKNFKLVQSQIVHRHGDRTILDRGTCWVGDTAEFNCELTTTATPNDEPGTVSEPAPQTLFRLVFLPDKNYQPGNCSAGQLTYRGSQQLIQNGQVLRDAYVNKLKFLDPTLNRSQVYFRADNDLRVIQSSESLISGLYPSTSGSLVELIDINTMDYALDDMQGNSNLCPLMDYYIEEATTQPDFQQVLQTELLPFFEQLSALVGYTVTAENYYHLYDCAVVHRCFGKEMPAGLNDDLLFEMGNWMTWVSNYAYTYPSVQVGSQVGIGFLIKEIFHQINQAVSVLKQGKTPDPRFIEYSAHDTTVLPILAAYQVSDGTWVPYASTLLFELYHNSTTSSVSESQIWVRLIYNGQPMVVPGCHVIGDGLCSYGSFKNITSQLVPPDDYQTFCQVPSLSSRSVETHKFGTIQRGHVERTRYHQLTAGLIKKMVA